MPPPQTPSSPQPNAPSAPAPAPKAPPPVAPQRSGTPGSGHAPPLGPFAQTQYRFTTGLRSGEIAQIRGEADQVLLTYRSFASIVGTVATLVAGIVAVAGVAGVLLLAAEGAPLRALLAGALTIVFAFVIALLVPRTQVTLYEESQPALTISQRALFPSAVWVVSAPNGAQLGELHKSALSRLGRNRWTILQGGRYLGEAHEDSLGGAIVRKLLGKFSRRFETDVLINAGGIEAGRVVRRRIAGARADVLELTGDAIDRRVVVALATLILGREP